MDASQHKEAMLLNTTLPSVRKFPFSELPEEVVRSLESLGRQEGATLFMASLMGFMILMSRYAGSDDIVVIDDQQSGAV